jgi:outer membrane receptor for ferrienterochelin and colicins
MKHILFVLNLFLAGSLTCYAQKIMVADSASKAPIVGATVAVFNQATNQIERQGITDVNGVFNLANTSGDSFYLSLTAIGYKKVTVKKNNNDQTIWLATDNKKLKEVNITANKSPVKFNTNIMEYDISQIPNADYLNLPDIIDQLPFLRIEDGAIKMMGESLTILIDNKPNLIYKDAEALKAIPPQAIEKVEVTITPTSRNNGKTINITLKHDYFLGWNGSAEVPGSRLNASPSGAVSYWRKKFGIDASTSYSYANRTNTSNTVINYFQPQSTLTSAEETKNSTNTARFSLSAYYNLNNSNTLDFQYSLGQSKNRAITHSDILTQTTNAQTGSFFDINSNGSSFSNNIGLNFTHKYPKAGNVFYILSRFSASSSNKNQLLTSPLIYNDLAGRTRNNETSVEVIQQQNANKNFRYTVGSKLIIRNNISDNMFTTNAGINNASFNMQQWVSSTYVDVDWTIKKLTAHTGLRLDYNENKYTQPVITKQHFTNLIPNLSLTYNINQANLLAFTYSSRVVRPANYALNPTAILTNVYQQTRGDERTGNEVNHYWGAQYYGNYKNLRLGFNTSYSRTRGLIREIFSLDGANVIESVSTNVDLNESITAGFSADFTLLKKVRLSFAANNSYVSQSNGIYTNHRWSGYTSNRANYQLNKSNSFGINMLAYSPNINLQGVDQSMAYINWGITYGHYFDLAKKFPTSLNISVSNPDNYNGLPGYSTTNTPTFSLRRDTKAANAVIGISLRVQFRGKQYGNRTFNKEKSISNNDLSTQ